MYTTSQDKHTIARIGKSYARKWVYNKEGEEFIKNVIRTNLIRKQQLTRKPEELNGLREWYFKKIREIRLPDDEVHKKWLFSAVHYWLREQASSGESKKTPLVTRTTEPVSEFKCIDITERNDFLSDFYLEQEYKMVQERLLSPPPYKERSADEAYIKTIEDEISKRQSSTSAQEHHIEAAKTIVLNYDDFSLPDGRPKSNEAEGSILKDWQKLEQVYIDAVQGNVRAKGFWQYLEADTSVAGKSTAEQFYTCQVIPAMQCSIDWSRYDFLRKDEPGAVRLRQVLADSFEKHLKEIGAWTELAKAAVNVFLAGVMVKSALGPTATEVPAAARGEAGALEGEARTTARTGEGRATGESEPIAAGKKKATTTAAKIPQTGKVIDMSTSDTYHVIDATNSRFCAWAKVEDGYLQIDMRTKLEGGTRSTVLYGEEQFANILKHFEGQFKGIKGNWSILKDGSTNLETFNKLIVQPGMSMEKAALGTWTGQQASKAGFTKVTIDSWEGSVGAFTKIKVTFTRE